MSLDLNPNQNLKKDEERKINNSLDRVLITGGFGFIGKVLLRELLKREDIESIHIVDNLCNSSVVKDLPSKVSFFNCSVSDFNPTSSYTKIYHLASPVGPAGVLNYAGKMGPMIITDTYKMAQLALKNNARLIDISTSEVYGKDPGNIPQKEDIEKIVPAHITVRLEYGVSKLASEVSLLNLVRTTDLQVNIIRPFNIVGPSQSGEVGFVLPRFIKQALENKPLTVFGDGSQKRTFTSVNDFVRAIISIMDSSLNGEILNVGNPNNLCSVFDLAQLVIKLTSSTSKIELTNPKDIYGSMYEEAWNKIPDITKIQTLLGWSPSESIEMIVLEAINIEKKL